MIIKVKERIPSPPFWRYEREQVNRNRYSEKTERKRRNTKRDRKSTKAFIPFLLFFFLVARSSGYTLYVRGTEYNSIPSCLLDQFISVCSTIGCSRTLCPPTSLLPIPCLAFTFVTVAALCTCFIQIFSVNQLLTHSVTQFFPHLERIHIAIRITKITSAISLHER